MIDFIRTILRESAYPMLLLLLVSACDTAEAPLNPVADNPFLITEGDRTLVVAHRGGRDLFPENTLLAFDRSVQMGVDVLEIDVHITKDDRLVACHDATIDRTSDGAGLIRNFTLEELRMYNFGYEFRTQDGTFPYRDTLIPIPTLDEIFTRYPQKLMIIEIKNTGTLGQEVAAVMLQKIKEYQVEDYVSVFSFDPTVMDRFNELNDTDIYNGGSISDVLSFILAVSSGREESIRNAADVFSVPLSFEGIDLNTDSPLFLDAAHRKNIAVHYWTINDKPTMISLIQAGADGIITDRPDLLMDALDELGF